eukprot:m.95515 g.95515  ORF g.95515 m.95515 type:complete len:369 (+) comp16601_c0_seq1:68-1174(+)
MAYILRTTAVGFLGLSTPKAHMVHVGIAMQARCGCHTLTTASCSILKPHFADNRNVSFGGSLKQPLLNNKQCGAATFVRTNMNQRRRNMKKQMESQKQKKLAAEARMAKLEKLQKMEELVGATHAKSKHDNSEPNFQVPPRDVSKELENISKKSRTSIRRAVPKQQPPPASDVKDMRLMRGGIGRLIDPYIPLEPQLRPSFFSTDGLKYRWNHMKKTLRSLVGVAVIKRKKIPFQAIEFAEDAQVQFVEAMYALQKDDKLALRNSCTDDTALQLRADYRKKKKFSWDFVGQIERPRVIHTSTFAVGEKGQEQYFAQVTVRFHTKQCINGENREMVDYVVFERFLEAAMDGKWLMCGKVKPPQSWEAMQ